MDPAIEFLLHFGGAEIYLARRPGQKSRAAALVGPEKAVALAQADHLLQRRVPLVTPWLAACLRVQGWPVAEIARRMRITDVTVHKHLGRFGMSGASDT